MPACWEALQFLSFHRRDKDQTETHSCQETPSLGPGHPGEVQGFLQHFLKGFSATRQLASTKDAKKSSPAGIGENHPI